MVVRGTSSIARDSNRCDRVLNHKLLVIDLVSAVLTLGLDAGVLCNKHVIDGLRKSTPLNIEVDRQPILSSLLYGVHILPLVLLLANVDDVVDEPSLETFAERSLVLVS